MVIHFRQPAVNSVAGLRLVTATSASGFPARRISEED
jgi:hypothetical protein